MIRRMFFPGILDTGLVCDRLFAIRDGIVNMYIVSAPKGLVCFDAGFRRACVTRGFKTLELEPKKVAAVFLTHSHWDHARGVRLFPDSEAYMGELEHPSRLLNPLQSTRPWTKLSDGQTVEAAGLSVRVVSTPGHTAGSVSYVVENRLLFTGDTLRLRRGEVLPFLRCFNSDGQAMVQSIESLAGLKGIEWLLTGHTGATRDVAAAFRRWRGTSIAPLQHTESQP